MIRPAAGHRSGRPSACVHPVVEASGEPRLPYQGVPDVWQHQRVAVVNRVQQAVMAVQVKGVWALHCHRCGGCLRRGTLCPAGVQRVGRIHAASSNSGVPAACRGGAPCGRARPAPLCRLAGRLRWSSAPPWPPQQRLGGGVLGQTAACALLPLPAARPRRAACAAAGWGRAAAVGDLARHPASLGPALKRLRQAGSSLLPRVARQPQTLLRVDSRAACDMPDRPAAVQASSQAPADSCDHARTLDRHSGHTMIRCYRAACKHHSRAFWKSRSQGEGPSLARPACGGVQGCCQPRKHLYAEHASEPAVAQACPCVAQPLPTLLHRQATLPCTRVKRGRAPRRPHLSGWGMSARWRPSGEHSAAMPSGEPFGLAGYACVGAPPGSQYLRAAGRRQRAWLPHSRLTPRADRNIHTADVCTQRREQGACVHQASCLCTVDTVAGCQA